MVNQAQKKERVDNRRAKIRKLDTQPDTPISCFYTNADTLTNKLSELKAQIEEHSPQIVAVTEETPENYRFPVQKVEIMISDDYDVFPDDISNKGRGITIQIVKSLKAQQVSFSTTFDESLWCEINLTPPDKLLVGCIYRIDSGASENNDKLKRLLLEASSKKYSHLLIMGDFKV